MKLQYVLCFRYVLPAYLKFLATQHAVYLGLWTEACHLIIILCHSYLRQETLKRIICFPLRYLHCTISLDTYIWQISGRVLSCQMRRSSEV